MALLVGFDPGGTGKKWAYACAASETHDSLLVGRLRDPDVEIDFSEQSFPYLSSDAIVSIRCAVGGYLAAIIRAHGWPVDEGADPIAQAATIFGGLVVSIDAPSGFAIAGENVRNTEQYACGNFNTPDQETFVSSAKRWIEEDNKPPLQQRVFWKLVGFSIYTSFNQAASATAISASVTQGLTKDLIIRIPDAELAGKIRLLESFPTQTYRTTSSRGLDRVKLMAGRIPRQVEGFQISQSTFDRFKRLLTAFHAGDTKGWCRQRGAIGDALDAFATMMLCDFARSVGVRAIAHSLKRLKSEGTIVVAA